jgi:hypothetical protein
VIGYLYGTVAMEGYFHFELVFPYKAYSISVSAQYNKIIGNFFENRQCTANHLVLFPFSIYLYIDFSDRNDQSKALTTCSN